MKAFFSDFNCKLQYVEREKKIRQIEAYLVCHIFRVIKFDADEKVDVVRACIA